MLGKGTSSDSETVFTGRGYGVLHRGLNVCRAADACAGGHCQEILQSRAKVPARHRSEYFNVVNKGRLQENLRTNLCVGHKST